MKKLLTAFVLLSTLLFVVSCGKKKENVATTPNDCYNRGMNPAYYGNNQYGQQYGQQYGNQYGSQYGSQYGNQYQYGNQMYGGGNPYQAQYNPSQQWNPYNVGCVGYPNGQYPTNGQYPQNGGYPYQQFNYQGAPYYYVPQTTCSLGTPSQGCPMGYVCQKQPGMYMWQLGYGCQGVCTPVQY